MLQDLPEGKRVTVLLVCIEAYRYREAVEMPDIPIGTVMSRLAATLKNVAATSAGRSAENG